MSQDAVVIQVEKVVQSLEVEAVVRALSSGRPLRLGEMIDYDIPRETHAGTGRPHKPYRMAVEQWHLDAAQQYEGMRRGAQR